MTFREACKGFFPAKLSFDEKITLEKRRMAVEAERFGKLLLPPEREGFWGGLSKNEKQYLIDRQIERELTQGKSAVELVSQSLRAEQRSKLTLEEEE